MKQYTAIRPSPIAGTWYPRQAKTLTKQLKHYLSQVNASKPTGKIWGLVVPHAGYRYSGLVAAHAFQCLAHMQFETLVIISPSHRHAQGPLLTSPHQFYETPLGQVEVEQSTLKKLSQSLTNRLGFGLTAIPHDQEHAIEIELPFLQYLLGKFRLVPLMMLDQSRGTALALAQSLVEVLAGQNILLIASSDLSHFYPHSQACALDKVVLDYLAQFDPAGIIQADEEKRGFACGRGAIAAVLWAAEQLGANQATVLHQATSGDASGDYERVVGYGAGVIWEKG